MRQNATTRTARTLWRGYRYDNGRCHGKHIDRRAEIREIPDFLPDDMKISLLQDGEDCDLDTWQMLWRCCALLIRCLWISFGLEICLAHDVPHQFIGVLRLDSKIVVLSHDLDGETPCLLCCHLSAFAVHEVPTVHEHEHNLNDLLDWGEKAGWKTIPARWVEQVGPYRTWADSVRPDAVSEIESLRDGTHKTDDAMLGCCVQGTEGRGVDAAGAGCQHEAFVVAGG